MGTARVDQTATRLADGSVLVAGGRNASGALAGAELYDPSTHTWSPTGAMATPRWGATATLLKDGRVLVAGGVSGANYPYAVTATAEVYDPDTGTWSSAGSMATARWHHTATLLRDGRVLVVAGSGSEEGDQTATAELYDPTKNAWSAAASVPLGAPPGFLHGFTGHSATLLANGQVLVAGGHEFIAMGGGSGETLTFRATLYDPATDTWHETGSMNVARWEHSATLLSDGRVLVAGGEQNVDPPEPGSQALEAAEIYDPASGQWTSVPDMAAGRRDQQATRLDDGRVLVTGGIGDDNLGVAGAELFDPGSGTWAPAGTLTGRSEHTATLLGDGSVLVAGGIPSAASSPADALASAELFSTASSGVAAAPLSFGRQTVGLASGAAYVPVTNIGDAPLRVTAPRITGADAADFALVSDSCSSRAVAPGGACLLGVRFRPHAAGSRAAQLSFTDNTPAGSHAIRLTGVAVPRHGGHGGAGGQPGRNPKVSCHARHHKRHRSLRCTITYPKHRTTGMVRASLARRGRTVARGKHRLHGHRRVSIVLHPRHGLRRGRYALTVTLSTSHRNTAVTKRIRVR